MYLFRFRTRDFSHNAIQHEIRWNSTDEVEFQAALPFFLMEQPSSWNTSTFLSFLPCLFVQSVSSSIWFFLCFFLELYLFIFIFFLPSLHRILFICMYFFVCHLLFLFLCEFRYLVGFRWNYSLSSFSQLFSDFLVTVAIHYAILAILASISLLLDQLKVAARFYSGSLAFPIVFEWFASSYCSLLLFIIFFILLYFPSAFHSYLISVLTHVELLWLPNRSKSHLRSKSSVK